jgi:hypothetical protein
VGCEAAILKNAFYGVGQRALGMSLWNQWFRRTIVHGVICCYLQFFTSLCGLKPFEHVLFVRWRRSDPIALITYSTLLIARFDGFRVE